MPVFSLFEPFISFPPKLWCYASLENCYHFFSINGTPIPHRPTHAFAIIQRTKYKAVNFNLLQLISPPHWLLHDRATRTAGRLAWRGALSLPCPFHTAVLTMPPPGFHGNPNHKAPEGGRGQSRPPPLPKGGGEGSDQPSPLPFLKVALRKSRRRSWRRGHPPPFLPPD